MDKKYRVNEIFYSLQGEGRNTGRAAVFVRFSGCNLRCPFCDTDFSTFSEMTSEEILERVEQLNPYRGLVVVTGGEPSVQLSAELVSLLHAKGYEIAVETNGTHPLPDGIDWVTISPKAAFVGEKALPVLQRCNELKVVFDGVHEVTDYGILADDYFLQPCDVGDAARNQTILNQCIAYILQHPQWQLSLQTHKIIHVR